MEFSTEGFERTEKVGEYIKPGVVEMQITKIEYFESSLKKTPGMRFSFEGMPQEALSGNGQKMTCEFWLSDKAWPYTQGSLCDIADALGNREQLDKIKVSGAKEYILAISDIFTGKFARYLVQGEEIEGSEGKENWVKATLPLYPKVESMEIKDTKLFFDADKHISKLVVPDVDAMAKESATADGNDGLPF